MKSRPKKPRPPVAIAPSKAHKPVRSRRTICTFSARCASQSRARKKARRSPIRSRLTWELVWGDNRDMATLPNSEELWTVREYLRTSWSPDREYVDGRIEERNLGEKE